MCCNLLGFDRGHPRKITCTFCTDHTQVAEVTSRVVRIELGYDRGYAPSPEFAIQGDSLAPRSVHAQACRRRALRRCLQFVSVDEFQRPRRFGWSCVNLRHSECRGIREYQEVPRRYSGYTPNV